MEKVQDRISHVQDMVKRLERTPFPIETGNELLGARGHEAVTKPLSLLQILKRPGVNFADVEPLLRLKDGDQVDAEPQPPSDGANGFGAHVECAVKYMGYIERQMKDIRTVREMERKTIPIDFPYDRIAGLSTEARQKLIAKRPETPHCGPSAFRA